MRIVITEPPAGSAAMLDELTSPTSCAPWATHRSTRRWTPRRRPRDVRSGYDTLVVASMPRDVKSGVPNAWFDRELTSTVERIADGGPTSA